MRLRWHDDIGRGLALNSTQYNLSRIAGPAIAGVLMAGVGATACFAVSAASYLPFIGVALWILPRSTKPAPRAAAPMRPHAWTGISVILRQPPLRGALITVLVTGVLCAPLITFILVLVKEVFHGSAGRFSLAVAAFGAGGLLGAIGLLSVSPSVDRRRLTSGFALLCAMAVILVALCPWFWLVPFLLDIAGASLTISNTAANSLLQAVAAPHSLGQTVSLYLLALRGGLSIGALATGAAVSVVGVQRGLLVDGALALVLQVAAAWLWSRENVHAARDTKR